MEWFVVGALFGATGGILVVALCIVMKESGHE